MDSGKEVSSLTASGKMLFLNMVVPAPVLRSLLPPIKGSLMRPTVSVTPWHFFNTSTVTKVVRFFITVSLCLFSSLQLPRSNHKTGFIYDLMHIRHHERHNEQKIIKTLFKKTITSLVYIL